MISVKPPYKIFSFHIEKPGLANYLASFYLLRTFVIYRLTLFVSMSSFFTAVICCKMLEKMEITPLVARELF